MADKLPEYLSAEELRNRLYHSLRNRGLVNNIKSQLRTSLITELQQSIQGPLTLRDLDSTESDPLLLRAANSLVADHLRQAKYEYSLGVFLPESGLAQDKIFPPEDLLKLLHVSPQSRLFQRLWLKARENTEKGLLWHVLSELAALHANASQDFGVQVDLIHVGPAASLDAKLHSLEELYSSRRDDLSRSCHSAVEERMLSYQRHLEDRYNSQLKLELARLKDSEIARMRMEEKEDGRREIEKIKKELQRTYQEKFDALVERERNSIERLQKEQEIQEKEVYSQRQMLLSEIESIRNREAELKREAEVNMREKHLTEERNKAKEDELRRRELELRNKEMQFEQRLQNEMAQFKLDQQAKFITRVQNVEVREIKVKEEERIVAEEKNKVQALKDELRDKTHRVNELETILQEARHAEVTATRHNEFINAKLRDMADYKTLKEQNVQQRNELETLRTRLSELLTMNERERGRQEELLRELRRPTPETLMMQRDLERARENLRQEQIVFEQQKNLLESRLKDELDRNKELVQRLEEQMLQMKEMNREVVDLRKQLVMTQTVLNNEVYRKPKDNDENQSVLLNASHASSIRPLRSMDSQPLKVITPNIDERGCRRTLTYLGDKDVYNEVDLDLDLRPVTRHRCSSDYSDDYSSAASADIVAETKYRLQGLEKEAQNLERAFQDFHYQATNITALPSAAPPVTDQRPSSHKADIPLQTGYHSQHLMSPPHSPIPHDTPLSSTPYKSQPTSSYHNDSFEELRRGKLQYPPKVAPDFDLSNMFDNIEGETSKQDLIAEARQVKSRPITVDDLEARPGSPSMLVVAGSESGEQDGKVAEVDPRTRELSVERGHITLPPISLDKIWKQDSPSLDDAWKDKNNDTKVDERDQDKNDKGGKLNSDSQLHGLQKESEFVEGNGDTKQDIDPVMLQYMARVQEMKEKEQEIAQNAVKTWSKGLSMDHSPSQSEDISVVDVKSETDDDVW